MLRLYANPPGRTIEMRQDAESAAQATSCPDSQYASVSTPQAGGGRDAAAHGRFQRGGVVFGRVDAGRVVAGQGQPRQPAGVGRTMRHQSRRAGVGGAFFRDDLAPQRRRQFGTVEYLGQLARDGVGQRILAERGGVAGGADHHRQQAGLGGVELAAVEHELAPQLPHGIVEQGEEGLLQGYAGGVLQVAGGDRFGLEAVQLGAQGAGVGSGDGGQQRRGVAGGGGEYEDRKSVV